MPRAPKKSETTGKSEKPAASARVKQSRRTSAKVERTVTDVEISRLAYQIYEARGRTHGSPLEDWLRAEQELANRAEG
jgi:hypothetical protein